MSNILVSMHLSPYVFIWVFGVAGMGFVTTTSHVYLLVMSNYPNDDRPENAEPGSITGHTFSRKHARSPSELLRAVFPAIPKKD